MLSHVHRFSRTQVPKVDGLAIVQRRKGLAVRQNCQAINRQLLIGPWMDLVLQLARSHVPNARAVTAKEIETFGEELVGKKCQMACIFNKLDDGWVRLKLHDPSFIGVYIDARTRNAVGIFQCGHRVAGAYPHFENRRGL